MSGKRGAEQRSSGAEVVGGVWFCWQSLTQNLVSGSFLCRPWHAFRAKFGVILTSWQHVTAMLPTYPAEHFSIDVLETTESLVVLPCS